ncbi:MAG: alpha/beta hydrolase [Planctomycetes bacterium]|nr:alpha/beta hydrolase [Planctomycetota bacterium]
MHHPNGCDSYPLQGYSAIRCAVMILGFVASAMSQTDEQLPVVRRLDGVVYELEPPRTWVYHEEKGVCLELVLHAPKAKGPHPCVLVIGGGAWRVGGAWSGYARALAREGVAAVTMTHRTIPEFTWPAQIEDAERAMRFLRHHAVDFGIDPTRIGVAGVSSGAQLAAMLGTRPDARLPGATDQLLRESTRPSCVLSYSGPMDLVYDPGRPPAEFQAQLVLDLVGFSGPWTVDGIRKGMARCRTASPIYQVDAGDPPFLLVHGAKDGVVTPDHSRRMAAKLVEVNVTCVHLELPEADHMDYLWDLTSPIGVLRQRGVLSLPPWWAATRHFLSRHLVDTSVGK